MESIDRGEGASLTSDGISEEFFELLWSKDELNFGPSINIPDTIVFKYGQPMTWYFTAHNGRIKKKNRANLISARIDEAFTKHILGYDVIASFISVPVHDGSNNPSSSSSSSSSGGGAGSGSSSTTTIEFLDKEGLKQFLYNRRKEDSNGLLQRFIEPKGVKNELIRSIWSPKVCLLERAENIHQLHDHRYGLYERCVTLEGPEYYITSAPLRGPVLAGQIQKICENVVSHISEVTFGQKQVTRLVVNFKVDSRDKIWLIYSTSIRLNDALDAMTGHTSRRQLVNIDNVVEIPNTVNLNPVKSFDKVVAKRRIQCISCAIETLDDMRHPITYKSVIKHYEHVLHIMGEISGNRGQAMDWPPDADIVEAAGGVGFGCMQMVGNDDSMNRQSKVDSHKPLLGTELHIPPLLRYLHPKLTGKSYYQCRKDPLFLYKTATVCEPCYLVYAEFTTMLLRMGGDLSKMMTPDPNAVRGLQEQSISTRGSLTNKTGRPSSADWRAMSSVNRSTDGSSSSKFVPSANHAVAKKKSIGLRTSDARAQPAMPRTIRKIDDAEPLQAQYSVDSYGSMLQIPSAVNTQMSIGRSVSMGQLGSSYGASGASSSHQQHASASSSVDMGDDISAIVAERERNFFREIARNPQLKDQHPLMHLISAHQKLKAADEASGVMTSKGAAGQKSLFGTRYGKQAGDKFDDLAVYAVEQPYFIKGEIILPSEYKRLKTIERARRTQEKAERIRRKKARAAAMNAPSVTVDGVLADPTNPVATLAPMHNAEGEFNMFQEEESAGGDITSTKSAKKHRDFLRDTLRKLEGEVDQSAGFIDAERQKERDKEGKKKKAVAAKPAGASESKKLAPQGKSVSILVDQQHHGGTHDAAPSSPSSPDNLENFFQLAASGTEFLPPRSGAGLSAAASRPSTTANSTRDERIDSASSTVATDAPAVSPVGKKKIVNTSTVQATMMALRAASNEHDEGTVVDVGAGSESAAMQALALVNAARTSAAAAAPAAAAAVTVTTSSQQSHVSESHTEVRSSKISHGHTETRVLETQGEAHMEARAEAHSSSSSRQMQSVSSSSLSEAHAESHRASATTSSSNSNSNSNSSSSSSSSSSSMTSSKHMQQSAAVVHSVRMETHAEDAVSVEAQSLLHNSTGLPTLRPQLSMKPLQPFELPTQPDFHEDDDIDSFSVSEGSVLSAQSSMPGDLLPQTWGTQKVHSERPDNTFRDQMHQSMSSSSHTAVMHTTSHTASTSH